MSIPWRGACSCKPSYEAWVYSKRDGGKIRKTFPNMAEAKTWRADAEGAVRKRTLRAPSKMTLAQAAAEWLEGAKAGTVRTRSGDAYKPGALRSYEQALRLRILPELGEHRLTDITRFDLADFVDRLKAQGLSPSTIQVTAATLGVIYGRALERGLVAVYPTKGVKLPRSKGGRKRIVSPEVATELLAALPEEDRPLWATAMYAGLRRGELRALKWEDIDLANNVLHVRRSWDADAGAMSTKSDAERKVPIPSILRHYLVEHRIRAADPEGLAFGKGEVPFSVFTVRTRALRAWKAAGLEPITPHEARHTYASTMIAAGVNAKAISEFMGHSSIKITYDTYGHLMPGNEAEAAGLLDAYLDRFE